MAKLLLNFFWSGRTERRGNRLSSGVHGVVNNLKKSPKLLYLDTGLVNYHVGLRTEVMNIQDINAIYYGQLSEQIVGQGLLSQAIRKNINLTYWHREQKGSISEIDFLISSHNRLIPFY